MVIIETKMHLVKFKNKLLKFILLYIDLDIWVFRGGVFFYICCLRNITFLFFFRENHSFVICVIRTYNYHEITQ